MAVNDAKTHLQDDPWSGDDRYDEKRQAIFEFWNDIPEFNRAWFEVVGVVPFDQILDIDDLGDEYVQAPHVYVAFAPGENGPFKKFVAQVETIGRWDRRSFQPGDRSDGRIEHFPGVLRKLDDKSE